MELIRKQVRMNQMGKTVTDQFMIGGDRYITILMITQNSTDGYVKKTGVVPAPVFEQCK